MHQQVNPSQSDSASLERDKEVERQAQALAAYVDKWTNVSTADAAEQQETLDYLRQVLDEDRLSDRKHFTE